MYELSDFINTVQNFMVLLEFQIGQNQDADHADRAGFKRIFCRKIRSNLPNPRNPRPNLEFLISLAPILYSVFYPICVYHRGNSAMDLEQLLAFDRIVREGSFSRAAWALDIAQPTISARIQALEAEVGGPLFVRNNRRVSLTECGVSFLPYARRALAALTDGVAAAQQAQQGQRGRLTVGALRSLTGGLLGPVLADFHASYPDVECYIEEGRHDQIMALLMDGKVELGLIAWPYVETPISELTPLLHFHEPAPLVAHCAHPLAQRKVVTQAEIAAQCDLFLLLRWWIVTPPPITHLASQVRSIGDLPTDTGRYLLLRGLGVGFFPFALIESELASGRIVELTVTDLPTIYRESALVHLARTTTLSTVATNFVAILRRHAERLHLVGR